jgi:hypothetical protein
MYTLIVMKNGETCAILFNLTRDECWRFGFIMPLAAGYTYLTQQTA